MRRVTVLLTASVLAVSCGRAASERAEKAEIAPGTTDSAAKTPSEAPSGAASVRVAAHARANLLETVSSQGRTAALTQQKVRAPFAGTLTELKVADGDTVRRGDTVGTVVSRDSEAALAGAREMAREASTDAEKRDAERAIQLAERGLVRAPLRASADGAVLSHAAASGDRVGEEQEILTIAEAASIVFLADVAQSDLEKVRPGQAAAVSLAGRPRPLSGVVHAVMPGANAADFTVPVRIDLKGLEGAPPIGLFGTSRITVSERRAAAVVPDAALLRDDITGTTRLAVVHEGRAHWITVTTGARGNGVTEILTPALPDADPVIVSGHVGLPEGAAVQVRP